MSEDRKARLAALAERAGRNQQPTNESKEESSKEPKYSLSFRNYVPKDLALDPSSLSAPAGSVGAGLSSSDSSNAQPLYKRQKISEENNEQNSKKSALELALARTNLESREAAGQNVGGGWSKVTPVTAKKVNWDLKRDTLSKMERLERRTQRAIVELLRERLEREAREDAGIDTEDSDLD
mmetsp:Transcript_1997/g.4323  ORF Transcript_1997/g.4323 Transcript_1997/m.4323 type:complete len:181 (+) Transcript_1997:67-609(+)